MRLKNKIKMLEIYYDIKITKRGYKGWSILTKTAYMHGLRKGDRYKTLKSFFRPKDTIQQITPSMSPELFQMHTISNQLMQAACGVPKQLLTWGDLKKLIGYTA